MSSVLPAAGGAACSGRDWWPPRCHPEHDQPVGCSRGIVILVSIHQPECLPWLGFVDKIRQCDVFVLLDSVQFRKNYFQNRNRVRTATGWEWVTVPVLTSGSSSQAIADVRIRADQAWPRKHCSAWRQHYGRAPFFAEYFPQLQHIYGREWRSVADFNIAVIEWLLEAFGLQRRLVRASALDVSGARTELLLRICHAVGADAYLSGVSGREYLDTETFRQGGVDVSYQVFTHPVYSQCYAPFIPEMSALDLLFNIGPSALETLAAPQPVPKRA